MTDHCRLRGLLAWLACLAQAVAACGGIASSSPTFSSATRPLIETPTTTASAASSPSSHPPFCPGRTWPPYPLVGIPGVTAISTDRATILLTNRTGQTYYYRVSGWEVAQFENCRAFGELERQRGPIAPGASELVMVDPSWQQEALRVTVGLWDKPCGEACDSEPIAAMVIEISPLEPGAS